MKKVISLLLTLFFCFALYATTVEGTKVTKQNDSITFVVKVNNSTTVVKSTSEEAVLSFMNSLNNTNERVSKLEGNSADKTLSKFLIYARSVFKDLGYDKQSLKRIFMKRKIIYATCDILGLISLIIVFIINWTWDGSKILYTIAFMLFIGIVFHYILPGMLNNIFNPYDIFCSLPPILKSG